MSTSQLPNAMQRSRRQEPPGQQISNISHLDGISYLYGHPLLNSLSPSLHQTIYNSLGLKWEQLPLSTACGPPDTHPPRYTLSPPIDEFLSHIRQNPKFVGSSVTMPWKVSIMKHLDDLTEEAREIGACNTIFLRREHLTGRKLLVGTNTDCIGIREALRWANPAGDVEKFCGKPALVFGGGGTARSAVYTIRKWLRCSRVYIVNRDAAEIEAVLQEDRDRAASNLSKTEIIPITDPEDITKLEEYPTVIVSAIPNYTPKSAEEIRARKILEKFLASSQGGVFLEMCYHPRPWTELADLASGFGWNVVLGSEPMIWQGLEQAKLWTGRDVVAVPGLLQRVKDFVTDAIDPKKTPRANL